MIGFEKFGLLLWERTISSWDLIDLTGIDGTSVAADGIFRSLPLQKWFRYSSVLGDLVGDLPTVEEGDAGGVREFTGFECESEALVLWGLPRLLSES